MEPGHEDREYVTFSSQFANIKSSLNGARS